MAKREIKEFEKTKNSPYISDDVVYVLLNRKIYEAKGSKRAKKDLQKKMEIYDKRKKLVHKRGLGNFLRKISLIRISSSEVKKGKEKNLKSKTVVMGIARCKKFMGKFEHKDRFKGKGKNWTFE